MSRISFNGLNDSLDDNHNNKSLRKYQKNKHARNEDKKELSAKIAQK